jgi:hypothetical protein
MIGDEDGRAEEEAEGRSDGKTGDRETDPIKPITIGVLHA